MNKQNLTAYDSEGSLSQEMALVSKKRLAGRGLKRQRARLMPANKQEGEYKPVTVYTDPLTGKRVAPDVGWSHNPASGLIESD